MKPLYWWWCLGISQRPWGTRRMYFTCFDCHLFERTLPHTHHAVEKKISSTENSFRKHLIRRIRGWLPCSLSVCCSWQLGLFFSFWNGLSYTWSASVHSSYKRWLIWRGLGTLQSGKMRPCHESRSILSLVKKTNKQKNKTLWYLSWVTL